MKISEFIKVLEEKKKEYGDVDVFVFDENLGDIPFKENLIITVVDENDYDKVIGIEF
jgi:hypothetical protein